MMFHDTVLIALAVPNAEQCLPGYAMKAFFGMREKYEKYEKHENGDQWICFTNHRHIYYLQGRVKNPEVEL